MYIWRVEVSVGDQKNVYQHLQSCSSFEKACEYVSKCMEDLDEYIISTDYEDAPEEEECFYYQVEDDIARESTYCIHKELVDRPFFPE